TGYLKSLDYARGRPQGRPVGQGPETPQVPLTGHADVRRMLLAQKSYVEGALALELFCASLVDHSKSAPADEAGAAAALLDVPPPTAPCWPRQCCRRSTWPARRGLGGAG